MQHAINSTRLMFRGAASFESAESTLLLKLKLQAQIVAPGVMPL